MNQSLDLFSEKNMVHHSIPQGSTPYKQSGLTLISLIFIAAVIGMFAIVVLKVFPAYSEYFSVRSLIHSMSRESLSTMSKKEIVDSFDRRANVAYITVITGKDLDIDKNSAGETVVAAKYQVIKPIVANVSIMIDFETSTNDK